jgi:hypothetical protein
VNVLLVSIRGERLYTPAGGPVHLYKRLLIGASSTAYVLSYSYLAYAKIV